MHPIDEFGSDAQKEKYLPRLGKQPLGVSTVYNLPFSTAKGEIIGAFVRELCFPTDSNADRNLGSD